jgi:4-amino-4-deoxy-L-arabinose transferase-like glycosyltransferase
MSSAKPFLLATAIFLLSLVPRTLFLQADPPRDLSWSLAPFTDDPAAMTPARLAVQERQGLAAGSAHPDSNPFVSLLLKAVMSVLGTGLWQGRILFAMAGSGCCVLLFVLVRKRLPNQAAVLAGLLLAGNFVFIQYNRLALEETLVIFFGMSALALVEADRPGIWRALAAGGCLAAGAVLVKLHGWLFVPVAGLAVCLSVSRSHGERKPRDLAAWLGAGAAGFTVVWLAGTAFGLKPVYAELGQYLRSPAVQPAAGPILAALGFFDEMLGRTLTIGLGTRLTMRMPMEVLLALVLTLSVASRHPKRWLQMDGSTTILLLWLLFGVLSLGLLRYRPLRYELLLVPPLCGLAALATILFK